jgi:hypothetical protein
LQGKRTVKTTLEAINQMQTDGVIEKYAIGGAGDLLPGAGSDDRGGYLCPPLPVDFLPSLAPIYDYLKARGCRVEDEYIVIGDWPVQFLPPSNDLEREAVEESVATTVEGVSTWVMTAEHLVALAANRTREGSQPAKAEGYPRTPCPGCQLATV